jgi:uncharacterized protein (DUF697 family)
MFGVLILVVVLAVIIALPCWAWWLRKRKVVSGWFVLVAALPVPFALLIGISAGAIGALKALGGNEVEPSPKARLLGESISEVMNLGCLVLTVALVLVVVYMTVLTLRARRINGGLDR